MRRLLFPLVVCAALLAGCSSTPEESFYADLSSSARSEYGSLDSAVTSAHAVCGTFDAAEAPDVNTYLQGVDVVSSHDGVSWEAANELMASATTHFCPEYSPASDGMRPRS